MGRLAVFFCISQSQELPTKRETVRVCFLTQPRSPGWCAEDALLAASCGDGSALEPVHPSRVGRGQEGA